MQYLHIIKFWIRISHKVTGLPDKILIHICIKYSQSLQKPVSGKLDVQLKQLEDYFMTDSISRASPTMAKCVQAVLKQKQSPY